VFWVRCTNIPRCLPRATRAASLSCILMLSVPVELCDTAEIAAAVSSSSLPLGTSETVLTITLTRWPRPSSSSRTWTPHGLGDVKKRNGRQFPQDALEVDFGHHDVLDPNGLIQAQERGRVRAPRQAGGRSR
jgi:hypothetical protein